MCCKKSWTFNTCLFTQWSRVLLEQLTDCLIVKRFPTFCGTRKFIVVFTSARYLSLSWAISVQSMPPYPTSWRPILILSSHPTLGLPSGLVPSDFPTKSLYTPLVSPHTWNLYYSRKKTNGKKQFRVSSMNVLCSLRDNLRTLLIHFLPVNYPLSQHASLYNLNCWQNF